MKDKKLKIRMESRFRNKRACTTSFITVFDHEYQKSDDLWVLYEK